MGSNTTNLDDGKYITMSSLSLTAAGVASSGATFKAAYVTAATGGFNGSVIATTGGAGFYNQLIGASQSTTPDLSIGSESSLGLYRSAASTIAQSYGTFAVPGISITQIAFSSGTTNQSLVTAKVGQGQLIASVLSLTSNGAQLGVRSGNTVWIFESTKVG